MENSWILLYNCPSLEEAHLIKGLLNENEVIAVIINKKDSSYLFGEFEVFVSSEEILKAKEILNGADFKI